MTDQDEVVRLLQTELADTNREVLILTLELDKRIEDLRAAEAELRRSLAEKTTLLKEVHHRVNNNLQVICSLLSLQLSSAESCSNCTPLQDAHARVLSMALIHERLYQSETLADLDFGAYILDLSRHLFAAYCLDAAQIRLDLSIGPVRLGVDRAIPCGLILNELLSNALKHGFPNGRGGQIRISLKTLPGNRAELIVADEGIGLPHYVDPATSQSLGLTVIRTLIYQLRATYAVSRNNGTTFTVTFAI